MSKRDLWNEQYATPIHYPPRKCIVENHVLYCRTLISTVDTIARKRSLNQSSGSRLGAKN